MINSASSQRVIITGANGFIGSSILRDLKNSNIECLGLQRKHQFEYHDKPLDTAGILTPIHWLETINEFRPTKLILCDWQGVSSKTRSNTGQFENVLRWRSITEKALECGVRKIVALGSQAELSPVQDGVIESEDFQPRSEYGIAKQRAYEDIKQITKDSSTEFVWARIFSVYGESMSKDLFLRRIMSAIHNQNELKTSALTQVWNFLHEKDCARALRILLEKGETGIYHVASKTSLPLIEVVELVARKLGKPITLDIGSIPFRDDDTMVMRPNINKLLQLGWDEEVTLESGINRMIHEMSKE